MHVEELLSLADVDHLLGAAARRPEVRLVKEGSPLPAERWSHARRLGGRLVEDIADPELIFDEFAAGATVVLQGLHLTWPPIGDWCQRLQGEISHPVQANAYVSPAGATGLSTHADDHDVIVLQSVGTKRWDVEGLGQVELFPDDVLYLPAGTRHSASAQQRVSVHLTLGIPTITRRAAIERALDRSDDERLRRPLPLGFAHRGASEGLTHAMAAALAASTEVLGAFAATELAERERSRALHRRPSRRVSHLRSLAEVEALTASSLVRLRDDRRGSVSSGLADDGRALLRLRDRQLLMPSEMDPAVRALLSGDVHRIDELPGLDDDDSLVLVRRLVREGVLQIADADDRSIASS